MELKKGAVVFVVGQLVQLNYVGPVHVLHFTWHEIQNTFLVEGKVPEKQMHLPVEFKANPEAHVLHVDERSIQTSQP